MDESKKKLDLKTDNIQSFIYAGYLFLLMLGIANDAIFYKLIGVNIIRYSNILDVLLSPLVLLVEKPIMLAIVMVLPIFGYYYIKAIHYFQNRKKENPEKFKLNAGFILFIALMNFFAFIGFGIGKGFGTREKMREHRTKIDHTIEFRDGKEKKVTLIGNNSDYIFYILEGDSLVSISPLKENVVRIEAISE